MNAIDFYKKHQNKVKTIIINYKTPESTLLAVLSAVKFLPWKIELIDCSPEENKDFFMQHINFENVEYKQLPLNIHGLTLDKIFTESKEDFIMLLDSDAEIVNLNFLNFDYLDDERVFGSGFVHGPQPFSKESSPSYKFLYYQERMWIPCTLLNVKYVKEAISNGYSFKDKNYYNETKTVFFGKVFARRFRIPFFQKHDFVLLKPFRKRIYHFNKPSLVYYDTGSDIYCYLKYKMNLKFLGLPAEFSEDFVKHYHGLTRKVKNSNEKNTGNSDRSRDIILSRLKDLYKVSL